MSSEPSAKAAEQTADTEQSRLLKTAAMLNKALDPTSKGFIAVAGAVITAMMFLTFFDVLLRYLINSPISGSLELTEFMMLLLVIFSLGYTGMRKGHIRVDLVLMYLPQRVVRILDVLTYASSAIFYILICWRAVLNGLSVLKDNITSAVLFIPVYPFAFIVILGSGLLVLVFIKDTIESIYGVIKRWR